MTPSVEHAFDLLVLAGIEGAEPLTPELAASVLRLAASLRDGEVSLPIRSGQREGRDDDARLRWNPGPIEPVEHPLVVHAGRLYFGRYFEDLRRLALAMSRRAASRPQAAWLPPPEVLEGLSSGQNQALSLAGQHAIAFVTGGPGTGKTHLIQSLVASVGAGAQALLLAPTGKAAGRLPRSENAQVRTIHRALGLRPGGLSGPKFNRDRPFDADLVVVDEVSMVGLTLLRQVVEAVAPRARLVLVGDKDQLQSVAAGSVLGPLLQRATESEDLVPLAPVAVLKESFRFGGPLAALARAAVNGDESAFFEALRHPDSGLDWVEYREPRALRSALQAQHQQVLCAHRHGPVGSEQLNGFLSSRAPGGDRPIIIRRNDEELGLFNGDVGRLLGDEAVFAERRLPRALLPPYESAYALTIHQSQGSEFDSVGVVLPPADSPLLSRELLYTAITRARAGLTLYGPEESLRACLRRPSSSAPGLVELLDQLDAC